MECKGIRVICRFSGKIVDTTAVSEILDYIVL